MCSGFLEILHMDASQTDGSFLPALSMQSISTEKICIESKLQSGSPKMLLAAISLAPVEPKC